MKIKELSKLNKRMLGLEERRKQRLKEAKENRNMRTMVDIWASSQLKTRILSDKQRMAIHYMTDLNYTHTNEWVAKKLGIDVVTICQWKNDPLFLREMDKEITRRRSFMRLQAFRNINRAINSGDMKSTWNYLKMSGDLKENVEITDKTGESEMDDNQLNEEISRLTSQLSQANVPSGN